MPCPGIVIKIRHEIHVQGSRSLKNREAPESRINGLPKIRYNQKKYTEFGRDTIMRAEAEMGHEHVSGFLQYARQIAY